MLLIAVLVAVFAAGPGASPAAETAGPSLRIMAANPLKVSGRGFKPSERVTVKAGPRRKTTVAGARGGFVVQFARSRCASATILAIGSKGSRAAAAAPKILCFQP